MKGTIHYFEESKSENTDVLLDLAKAKALERGIRHVVVASTRGGTGVKAATAFKDTGIQVTVVTHQTGFREPNLQQVPDETQKEIEALGAQIVTGTHAFVGLSRSLRKSPPRDQRPQPYWPAYVPHMGDLIADTLRLFSAGMKVCFEITLMAADAGAIPSGVSVIAVGGQGRGADTAIVVKSANTNRFFDLDVGEIIAKPIQKRLPVS